MMSKGRLGIRIYTVAGLTAILSITVYFFYVQSSSQQFSSINEIEDQPDPQVNHHDSLPEETTPLAKISVNNPPPPPVTYSVGNTPYGPDQPDLSTPEAAVQSVLELIDQDRMSELDLCFRQNDVERAESLYPQYLGHPVELVEIIQEDEFAEVVWQATVQTAFYRDGRNWTPDETMTLKTILERKSDVWKIVTFHEGEESDVAQ